MKLNKNMTYIVVAIGLALLAALIAVKYVQKTVAEKTRDDREMVDVAVPSEDIAPGARLSKSDLAVRSVPADFVPADAVTPDNVDSLEGRILKAGVRGGAPLSAAALVPAADQFSTVIPQGKVAYTLTVDENNSINGMVAPGDLIDIFFIRDATTSGAAGTQILPLLQLIKVLATGTRLGERVPGPDGQMKEDGYSTVTLELDHYQAQQLAVAGKAGLLRVVLRKNADGSPGAVQPLTEAQLVRSLGGVVAPPPSAAGAVARPATRRSGNNIEFIIGGKG